MLSVFALSVGVCDNGYFLDYWCGYQQTNELPLVKTNSVVVRPAETQISLGIHPVWSESSLSAKLGPLATHWAHSEDSDQTGRMPRLILVFAGRTATLLVLSRGRSNTKRIRNRAELHILIVIYGRCKITMSKRLWHPDCVGRITPQQP